MDSTYKDMLAVQVMLDVVLATVLQHDSMSK